MLETIGLLKMVAERVELLVRSSEVVVADSLPVECMTFVVGAERMVAEQLVVANIVPDIVVSSSIASIERWAGLASMPVQKIHSLRSTATDTAQPELQIDLEWLFE